MLHAISGGEFMYYIGVFGFLGSMYSLQLGCWGYCGHIGGYG